MQGSYGDATERFSGNKERNNEKRKANQKDKDRRKRRQNRHNGK